MHFRTDTFGANVCAKGQERGKKGSVCVCVATATVKATTATKVSVVFAKLPNGTHLPGQGILF